MYCYELRVISSVVVWLITKLSWFFVYSTWIDANT